MSMIDIRNLTFAYDSSFEEVFSHVTLQLDTNWKLGFTGRNGRGKTTFLKLLCGQYAYQGSITAQVDFSYFPLAIAHKQQDTIEILRRAAPYAQDWQFFRELNLLAVCEDVLYRCFDTLSSGEQTKCLLAALFLRENHFLLIDEPTNHLDALARQNIGKYLKRKHGFILVSHDRALLDACTDHTLAIEKTDIIVQKGNFSVWYENKYRRDEFEREENEKLKKDISRLQSAAQRTSQWSKQVEKTKNGTRTGGLRPDKGYIGHKAAKMMQRSKNIEARKQAALEDKEALLKNIESADSLKLSPLQYTSTPLVRLQDLSLFYGEKQVFSGFNMEILCGERIALCGANGCGKSSILKLLYGQDIDYSGTFWRGSNLKISYVPQTTDHLYGNLHDYAVQRNISEGLLKAILRKLGFSREQLEKNIEAFSSGQKKKVLLAHSLCQSAHLYIWDEPLNFIDVLSRIQIEDLLKRYQPTMLFVEHDDAFCQHIATKQIFIDA